MPCLLTSPEGVLDSVGLLTVVILPVVCAVLTSLVVEESVSLGMLEVLLALHHDLSTCSLRVFAPRIGHHFLRLVIAFSRLVWCGSLLLVDVCLGLHFGWGCDAARHPSCICRV